MPQVFETLVYGDVSATALIDLDAAMQVKVATAAAGITSMTVDVLSTCS